MWTRNGQSVFDGLSTGPAIQNSHTLLTQSSSVQQTASSGADTLVYNCTVVFSISGTVIITNSNTTQITVKRELEMSTTEHTSNTYHYSAPNVPTGPSLPAAPVVQQPQVTSQASALIRWTVPEVTYSPEQYTVYYTPNISSCPESDKGYNTSGTVYCLNHTDFLSIRDQQYNVTLNNLHPYTVYCYKVVARNSVGRNESIVRTFKTNENSELYLFDY